MFAVRFDDLMRKVRQLDPPVELHKLTTVMVGQEEFETWLSMFLSDSNDTIHVEIEDDLKTYTFFTINPTKNTREKAKHD